MKDLVEYALIRGVKIVPEFDAPAHVGNEITMQLHAKL